MSKTYTAKYSDEVCDRAVRMVIEHGAQRASRWATIVSIAAKIGYTAQTLDNWVKQAERNSGARAGLSTGERERMTRRAA